MSKVDYPKLEQPAEDDVWVCKNCTFSNVYQLESCEMCDSPATKTLKKPKLQQPIKEPKKDQNICKDCTFINKEEERVCVMCGQQLKMKIEGPKKQKVQLVRCVSCRFENDPANQRCVGCDKFLKERPKPPRPYKKPRARGLAGLPAQAMKTCDICYAQISHYAFPAHYKQCEQTKVILRDESFRSTIRQQICHYCDVKFDRKDIEDHTSSCAKKIQFFENKQVFGRLTPLQQNAIIFMHDNSEKQHYRSKLLLLKRIIRLGYKLSDMEALHHYLEYYAPIIVHIHVSRYMHFFVKDTHYRNQFETKTSSGSLSSSARTQWENRMFSKRYSSATGFERVKYGTVNFTNDPKGVRACSGYGASYFLLKNTVRSRCTFTDMDSSSPSSTIGTFKFGYQVMNKMSDAEIRSAIEAAKANEMSSSVISAYKEIQIHGPIQFSKDIERLYVNKTEIADPTRLKEVKEFCQNNKVQYEIFEPQPLPGMGPFGGGFAFGVAAARAAVEPPPKLAPRFIDTSKLQSKQEKKSESKAPKHSSSVLFGYQGSYDDGYPEEEYYDEYEYEGEEY